MWGFIQKYNPELKIGQNKLLDELVQKSVAYYNNFVKPFKKYKIPSETEKSWLRLLANEFEKASDITATNLQNITYEVGKITELDDKEWFKLLYQVLLGLDVGPRFGTFVALYGVKNMVDLIKSKT
jgi:lysyl-tRNA synthetase class 1